MLVITLNQRGRPSKPHMKIRFIVSQSSLTGYNPGLCQSVTQKKSGRGKKKNPEKSLNADFKASINNFFWHFLSNVLHTDM